MNNNKCSTCKYFSCHNAKIYCSHEKNYKSLIYKDKNSCEYYEVINNDKLQ